MSLMWERVTTLLNEVNGLQKSAADGMGSSSHVSEKVEDPTLRSPVEGSHFSELSSEAKKINKSMIDHKPEMTEGSAPTAESQQLGDAKSTGKDPTNEKVTKRNETIDKRDGDMGGTSHPAKGSISEKTSADALASMSSDELFKIAAEFCNGAAADLAVSAQPNRPAQNRSNPNQAAAQGYKAAADAGDVLTKKAAEVIYGTIKQAQHAAYLVASHMEQEAALLRKAAAEGEIPNDPTGGESEGDTKGKPEDEVPPEGGEGGDPGAGDPTAGGGDDAERAALLQAMSGAGGAGGPGAGGPPAGPDAGSPPAALGGMNDEQALQELAMALQELGIDPAALAAAAPQQGGPKLASDIYRYKASGKFRFTDAKRGSAEREVRDYMKEYILEMGRRSRL